MVFDADAIEVLTFDIFGTVLDWRSTIVEEVSTIGQGLYVQEDWVAFANAWRSMYSFMLGRVNAGQLPWTDLEGLNAAILAQILPDYGLAALDDGERASLSRAWRRLQPWPDTLAALARLRQRYLLAALSNGNMALLAHVSRHAGLGWHAVFSAELVQRYKPDPALYTEAARMLKVDPSRIMMVAAHPSDLLAAQRVGFRTAYVERPSEFDIAHADTVDPMTAFDLVVPDLGALASSLGLS